MIDFPDILGMELHDAAALLEAEGLAFIIVETKPPKKELTEGVLRVIKAQTQTGVQEPGINPDSFGSEPDSRLVLTVCKI